MALSRESYPGLAFLGASVFASSDLRLSVVASAPITAPLMNGKAGKFMPKTMGIIKPIEAHNGADQSQGIANAGAITNGPTSGIVK